MLSEQLLFGTISKYGWRVGGGMALFDADWGRARLCRNGENLGKCRVGCWVKLVGGETPYETVLQFRKPW